LKENSILWAIAALWVSATLTGCAVSLPATDSSLAAFNGNYEVVEQVANDAFRLSEIDVRFTRDAGGISTANVRFQKDNVKSDVVYSHCVSPGPRPARVLVDRDENAADAIRCQAAFVNAPSLILIRSLDGKPVSFRPLTAFGSSQPITSDASTLATLDWGNRGRTVYFLRKTRDAAVRTVPTAQIAE